MQTFFPKGLATPENPTVGFPSFLLTGCGLSFDDLGVDSPFFSAIVLFKNQPLPQGFGGFLERRIPGKNGNGSYP